MDSYNFLPDNEVTEVEGRKYLNPNLVVDETNTFIDRLRNTQQANMQQTATQTQRLGTDVPSDLGGLTGAGSYWSSRYVTPQTSSVASNLRAAAQAQALNQALANEEARWKKRYQDAYNAYQKRAWDANKTPDPEKEYVDSGDITGGNTKQDINDYEVNTTIYDSTEVSHDNRSTERDKQIGITKDSSGNVTVVTINGVPHYGRDARAQYRYLKNAGLVRE